ncbi:MAG: hypothetical protein IH588_10820, partial [Anaerolineales bacterium]|nr:hypothetical protein [Anaerolineales bacterium]
MKQILKNILNSRAAWFFAAVWILSLIYLLATGNGIIGSSAFALGILIFSAITAALPNKQPDTQPFETQKSVLAWVQLLVVLFFVLLTGYRGFVFNMMPGRSNIPVWSWFADGFANIGGRYLHTLVDHSPGIAAANLAGYFLIPFVILVLLGARLPELGFG